MARRQQSGPLLRGRRRLGPVAKARGVVDVFRDLRDISAEMRNRAADVRANARVWLIRGLTLVTFVYLWVAAGNFAVAVLVTGAVRTVGLVCWFFYRQHRLGTTPRQAGAQLRRERALRRAWPLACQTADLAHCPPLVNVRAVGRDFSARVDAGRAGVTVAALGAGVEALADVLGCREVVVHPAVTAEGNYGSADLRFLWADPLTELVSPDALVGVSPGCVPYGVTDAGDVAQMKVLNGEGESVLTPVLVGGVAGAGKSSFIHAFLAGLIVQGIPVRLRIIDPAAGVEFAEYAEAFAAGEGTLRFRVVQYVDDEDDAPAVFAAQRASMKERLAWMASAGIRTLRPSVFHPLDLTIVDELLLLDQQLKKPGDMGKVQVVGRKCAHTIIGCAQQGHAGVLGAVRERFINRMVFRTETREQTETFIGSGKGDLLPAAHRIGRVPGVGYVYDGESQSMTKFRTVLLDNAQVAQVARGLVPDGWHHLVTPEAAGVSRLDLPWRHTVADPAEMVEGVLV